MMHIKNLTQKGAFVVGFPIKHSLSPVIFHYWFKKYKIEAFYDKLQIAPENFEQFINQLKNSCGSFPEKKTILLGGNVTIPHKEKALIMADNCSLEAKNIGAANFLYFKEKKLHATNTDAYGFINHLYQSYPDFSAKNAYIIGAGGAARAIIYALLKKDYQKIYLINRNEERAKTCVRDFGKNIIYVPFEKRHEILENAELIVNTTPLSMRIEGQDYAPFPLQFQYAKKTALCYDIVYNPLQTNFLQQAQQQGLKTLDGLGMLLHQAVPCFQILFGITPVIDEKLRAFILEQLVK